MADLKDRFRSLDLIDPPDLWRDATRRSPRTQLPPGRRPRERLVAATVALTIAIAGVVFAFLAFGGPRRDQPASEPSPTPAATSGETITIALDSGSGEGTLSVGDARRSYQPTGYCAELDCRRATYDPIPAEYVRIPSEFSLGFEGDLQPVGFRITSQSHLPSNFERTVDPAGDLAVHLPEGAFLFDITAQTPDGRYTHFYFGVTSIDPRSQVDAEVQVIDLGRPSSLSAIAYGEGSVWVTLREGDSFDEYSIVRLDAGTGGQISRIPVDTVPSWEVGGGGLVVANGSVWVAGRTFDRETQREGGEITQIDARSNAVVNTFALPAPVADLALDASGLWFLTSQDRDPVLERIDGQSGDLAASINLEGDVGRSVLSLDGTIFAVVRTGAPTYGDIVYQVDPATNAVSERFVTKESYNAIAETAGRMWMAAGDGLVWIDADAGQGRVATDTFNTGDVVAAGHGGVWVLSPKHGRAPSRYDIGSGTLGGTIDTGRHSPISLAAAPDGVWAANDDGTVTHVEIPKG
jgi:hypothetical protein